MAAQIISEESAYIVVSLDDLLIQILLCLPVKYLMRFKLVSKHWKSLITSRRFSLLRYPAPNPAVGLVYPGRKSSEFEYIGLDIRNPTDPPFTKLSFPEDPFSFWIQQSCNGLLLCCSSGNYDSRYNRSPIRRCYVYNPTTTCFRKLPRAGVLNDVPRIVHGLNLAYDHANSPFYQVVCVRGSEFARELFQIEIYSSESRVWRLSGEPFTATASFDHGVYWNGSIHWIDYKTKELLCFILDKERLAKVPLPARLGYDMNNIDYFGESCDHLHMIGSSRVSVASVYVYEMKRDYSEWFVKCRVDLTPVGAAFPDMADPVPLISRAAVRYGFSVFSVTRGEEKGSFLVLQISRKVVRFNLDCNSMEEISELGDAVTQSWIPRAFDHIESLACV